MSHLVLIDLIDTLVRLPFKPARKYLSDVPADIRASLRATIAHHYVSDLDEHRDFFVRLHEIERQSSSCRTLREIAAVWDEAYDQAEFSPGALRFLQRCQSAGLTVCVASNSLPAVRLLIERLSLAQHVDHIFLSCSLGHVKPSTDFFKKILRSGDSRKVWMIGNSVHKDLRPAFSLGCSVAWYEPGSEPLSQLERAWLSENATRVHRIREYDSLFALLVNNQCEPQPCQSAL